MDNIPETDQWKLEGDCDKCRRENYCNEKCRLRKLADKRAFDLAMHRAFEKVIQAPYEDYMHGAYTDIYE